MILYNVTIKVDQQIAHQWLHWLLHEHIPEVLESKCFISHRVVRLLEVDDQDGPTYAVQYVAESKGDYNRYIELFAPELRQRSIDKWGQHFIAFRSVMEIIQ